MCKKIFCLLLCAVILCSLLPTVTLADGNTYQLATLLTEGTIKPLGRTAVNPDGTGIMCDWPGNGFQMNVSGAGGTMAIAVSTDYAGNWVVLVDGVQVYWERFTSGGTISTTIPAGDHLVSVMKESDTEGKETNYCDLTTMTFPGTIEARPADKALTIEFIGDSYTCGHGTLGSYSPGYQWVRTEHSFTHGYAYYTTQNLNADYMIAARGGIGLFDGVSAEQPDDDPDATIADIYPYTAGFRKSAGLYDFAKKVDIVVVELGANDSIKESDANFTAAKWKEALESLTDTVREKYPDADIVFLSHRAVKYKIMKAICEERAASDPKLYAFSFAHQGNGSGTASQYYGHPNAADSKNLADALCAFIRERGLVTVATTEPAYNDYTYYASGSGADTNDGQAGTTAKKTISGVLKQAVADRTYAAGDRIVINVTGTVKMSDSNSQAMANVQVLTSDGAKVPILIQTDNNSGTKATLDTGHTTKTSSSRIVYFCNDMTLKNINFQSSKHSTADYWDYQLYAGYNHIVFDNVTFGHNGECTTKWRVSAGHVVANDSIPVPTVLTGSSITFKNGDYTNLEFATAVMTPKLYGNGDTSAPFVECSLIIEDGAKMSTVYNRYSVMSYGKITVEIKGGSVGQYIGTLDGTSSDRKTYSGDVNFVMSGGNIGGAEFNAVGRYATVNGGVNNTISGGIIEINPTEDYNTINFGGRLSCTIGSVTNNISGGMFFIVFDTAGIASGYYMGGVSSCTITGKVTNNISGGSFLPMDRNATASHSAIHFGVMSGALKGGLYNNITGGTFDMAGASNGGICLGVYSSNVPCPEVVNVIGEKDTNKGPMFLGSDVYMAGTSGAIGVTKKPTAMPDVTQCSDKVVVSNTFYNGYADKAVYCGPYEAEADGKYRFVLGSIENNFYGGSSKGTFYGAGMADVYGKVTTNLYGGHIGNIYAAGHSATIYDGVELNIYGGFEEYHNVSKNNSWYFRGGTYGANIPAPQTAGRDTIKVTIAPENPTDLTLYTPVTAACRSTYTVDGSVSVSVSGGIFPEGLSIKGVTVNQALAEGYVIIDTATGTKLTYADDETTTGATSVTVIREEDVIPPQIPEEYLATVQNGQIIAYATTLDEIKTAIASDGNSVVTLYGDITTKSAIALPYSCTLDLNGHTIDTTAEGSTSNGIEVKVAGTENDVTTLKNGTLRHYTLGIRIDAGGLVVDNMKILSNSGAPIGIYNTDGAYKSVNKITGSFLSSKSFYCISFNKDADFTNAGITVTDSVLVSYRASGYSVVGGKGTGGTVTFGKDVKLYSYKSTTNAGTTVVDGEPLTKTTGQSVTVDGTEYTGLNLWESAVSENVAVNANTGNYYTDLAEALASAKATGGTVRLCKDTNESVVTVTEQVTLDLNGHQLQADYFTCYGVVTDGYLGGDALLIVPKNIHITGQDSYLPIYDSQAGGYRLYAYEVKNMTPRELSGTQVQFGMRLNFANPKAYDLLCSSTDPRIQIVVCFNWTGAAKPLDYQLDPALMQEYARLVAADIAASGSSKKAIAFTVSGLDKLEGTVTVSMNPMVISNTSVTGTGGEKTWSGTVG